MVAAALARHRPDPADPIGVLAAFGGLEHAALAGFVLGAAALRVPVLLDGVNAGAAALAAAALAPGRASATAWPGTARPSRATARALAHLGLDPLLDLGMRLGEGTGALLALPVAAERRPGPARRRHLRRRRRDRQDHLTRYRATARRVSNSRPRSRSTSVGPRHAAVPLRRGAVGQPNSPLSGDIGSRNSRQGGFVARLSALGKDKGAGVDASAKGRSMMKILGCLDRPTEARHRRPRFAVALLASALVLTGCRGVETIAAAAEDRAPAVVDRGPVSTRVTATGSLVAISELRLGFPVRGQLSEVLVRVGDRVEPGQVLARVDDLALRQALEQSQAQLDAREAELERAEGATSVEAAQATLDQAKAFVNATEDEAAAANEVADSRGRQRRSAASAEPAEALEQREDAGAGELAHPSRPASRCDGDRSVADAGSPAPAQPARDSRPEYRGHHDAPSVPDADHAEQQRDHWPRQT